MPRRLEYTTFNTGSFAYILGYNHSIDPKMASMLDIFDRNPKGMADYEQGWADGQGDLKLAEHEDL